MEVSAADRKGAHRRQQQYRTLEPAAGITVHSRTNEVFVADGYGNRAWSVFDAEDRQVQAPLGAYGNKPDDKAAIRPRESGPTSQQFNTPHGITVRQRRDRLCDGPRNNRVQAVRLDGTFLKEAFIKRESRGTGTAFGVALSADSRTTFRLP